MHTLSLAKSRSRFYKIIREFFDDAGYTEVETPTLSQFLIPESAIEVFGTQLHLLGEESKELYLIPSPELFMKKLLSDGAGDIYQMSKCFRNYEHHSQKHYFEFTMLEWYAINKTYQDNLAIQKELLNRLKETAHASTQHLFCEFIEATIHELMLEMAGIDLNACQNHEDFKEHALSKGYSDYALKSQSWEELFNYIFISHVENRLPKDKTIFLKDYPAQIPTTAKRNGHTYERWEFYMNGWEMANCYTEESRYEEMRQLFEQEEYLKNKMLTPHKVDYDYLEIFKKNFPLCSGVALGVDRLFAIYMNASSLDEVTLFPGNRISTEL